MNESARQREEDTTTWRIIRELLRDLLVPFMGRKALEARMVQMHRTAKVIAGVRKKGFADALAGKHADPGSYPGPGLCTALGYGPIDLRDEYLTAFNKGLVSLN